MTKYYTICFLIFYSLAIAARFIVGTAHDERIQTSLKFAGVNKALQILLFLSFSKKAVAIHCVFWQIANILMLGISFLIKLPIMICVEIYVALFSIVIISLCVETVWLYVGFDGKWKDEASVLSADFRDGKYKLRYEDKIIDGYLERYVKRRCAFYDESGKMIFSARYKHSIKDKEFCVFIDGGETLRLKPVGKVLTTSQNN